MNEVQLIRALDDTELPAGHRIRPAREKLVAQLVRETDARGRRRAVVAVAGIAAAAVLVTALVVTRSGPSVPSRTIAAQTSSHASAASVSTRNRSGTDTTTKTSAPSPARVSTTTPALVQPALFLRRAAAAVRTQPNIAARPDQFLYFRDETDEVWLSIDGTHDGLTVNDGERIPLPGCRNGVVNNPEHQPGQPVSCTPDPAGFPDAPTTAPAMATYIVAHAGSSRANSLGKELMSIAQFKYLRPAARAALFEAAPLLPGLTLGTSSVSNLGHRAVAISWTFGDDSTALLFDPSTYAFLGCTTVGAHGEQAGGVTSVSQVLVDAVGERP